MDIYRVDDKYSVELLKVYKAFVCLLILSSLFGSKLFGIEIAGFTLFMDRIVLFIILLLFWPKIIKKIIFESHCFYIFGPMILIGIIALASQSILGMNQEYILASIKYIMLYFEFALFVSVITIIPNKNSLNKFFAYLMLVILTIGVFESLGIEILNNPILNWLPKTAQQYEDLNRLFYRGSIIRISSVYTHSLAFGTILSLYIPYLFYLYSNKILGKIFFGISIILSNYCLFLTYSRTAIAITISFYLFLFTRNMVSKKQNYLKKIIYVIIAIIVLSIILNVINNNLDILFPEGANDVSIQMRLDDYKFIQEGVSKSFLFGLGSGSYRNNYNNAIDNFYLTTLYENGMIGLILLIIFMIKNYNYLKKYLIGNSEFIIKYIFFILILYNITMDAFSFIEIMKFYLIILGLSSKTENSFN